MSLSFLSYFETATGQVVGVEHALLSLLILFVAGVFTAHVWYAFLASWLPSFQRKIPSSYATGATEEQDCAEEQLVTSRLASVARKPTDDSTATFVLPADLCGRIACYTGFQGVGALAACCKTWQAQYWESQEVWMALASTSRLLGPGSSSSRSSSSSSSSNNSGNNSILASGAAGWDARQAFRRAFFRTDLLCLRSVAAKGRMPPLLEEAAHVICGLLPDDLSLAGVAEYIQIASRALGAHDPESPAAVACAERLLRASRRCMELLTEEQLENLEYSYRMVHQLHALLVSSMRASHEDTLERSLWHGPATPATPAAATEFAEFSELCDGGSMCE